MLLEFVAARGVSKGSVARDPKEEGTASATDDPTEAVAFRGEGRWESKLPLKKPFTDPRLTQNAMLLHLVKGTTSTLNEQI